MIQSISITIPTEKCVNSCKFCCSKLHKNDYRNTIDSFEFFDRVKKRLKFARDKGVDTLILTSANGEALQNIEYLKRFDIVNKALPSPFLNIELQTTGVMFRENVTLLKDIGVETISLSIANLFDDAKNNEICGIQPPLLNIKGLCQLIKESGFNLRLSLNMTKCYSWVNPDYIFSKIQEFGANQVTFRKLYAVGDNKISEWIKTNSCEDITLSNISAYIQKNGRMLEKLSFGSRKYSVNEVSAVIDDDCMSTGQNENIKYMIIREDGRLYTRWEDKGSLLF
jgi:hypothetical protein